MYCNGDARISNTYCLQKIFHLLPIIFGDTWKQLVMWNELWLTYGDPERQWRDTGLSLRQMPQSDVDLRDFVADKEIWKTTIICETSLPIQKIWKTIIIGETSRPIRRSENNNYWWDFVSDTEIWKQYLLVRLRCRNGDLKTIIIGETSLPIWRSENNILLVRLRCRHKDLKNNNYWTRRLSLPKIRKIWKINKILVRLRNLPIQRSENNY